MKTTHLLPLLLSASLAAGVIAVTAFAFQKGQPLPPPFATPSSNNRPHVVSRPDGAQLRLPAGFHIDEWAAGFDVPRFMQTGPSGEILLSDSGKGAVYAFRNGRPNDRAVVVEGLNRPYGLAFWKNYLYVAETTSLKRYHYDSKTLKATAAEEIVSMHDFSRGHWTRSILFDPKGDKLYLGVGSSSNVDPGDPEMRAAITRLNPDGSGRETYASGTRNPIGMRWYPGTAVLWAAVQERDALGDDLVPDYITHIQQGGFYGWPYAYFGPHQEPRLKGQRDDLVNKTIEPDVNMGSHVAVLDMLFYTGTQFPASYRGGAFVAEHGSWNRSQRIGYSVAFVPFNNGRPAGDKTEFLTGWMLAPDQREVWGRPVGLLQMADGSMLVSDDGGKKIWRISYKP
jgi:glucose/arabinose dehydrogenase